MGQLNFVQSINVGGDDFHVIDSEVTLTLNRFGRARFLVESDQRPEGLVKFVSGYQGKGVTQWLLGFIESVVEVEKNQWRLFCRELSAVYYSRVPVSLRNTTLTDVVNALHERGRVAFSVPDKPYAKKVVPAFVGWGRGLESIDQLGRVFSIPDCVWYLQDDGAIYIGSHEDSIFHDKDLPLARSGFDSLTNHEGVLSIKPGLRPGYSVNGKRIQQVKIKNEVMTLEWL